MNILTLAHPEFVRLAKLAILRTEPLKFCSDCAYYNTPAGKEPCKDCLPRAAELPNYKANTISAVG